MVEFAGWSFRSLGSSSACGLCGVAKGWNSHKLRLFAKTLGALRQCRSGRVQVETACSTRTAFRLSLIPRTPPALRNPLLLFCPLLPAALGPTLQDRLIFWRRCLSRRGGVPVRSFSLVYQNYQGRVEFVFLLCFIPLELCLNSTSFSFFLPIFRVWHAHATAHLSSRTIRCQSTGCLSYLSIPRRRSDGPCCRRHLFSPIPFPLEA